MVIISFRGPLYFIIQVIVSSESVDIVISWSAQLIREKFFFMYVMT